MPARSSMWASCEDLPHEHTSSSSSLGTLETQEKSHQTLGSFLGPSAEHPHSGECRSPRSQAYHTSPGVLLTPRELWDPPPSPAEDHTRTQRAAEGPAHTETRACLHREPPAGPPCLLRAVPTLGGSILGPASRVSGYAARSI